MMLRVGLNRIRDLTDARIDEAIIGTGTTGSAVTDKALETPTSGTNNTTTNTTATQLLKVAYNANSTEGNTNTITEFGINNDSGDVYYSRVVFAGIVKNNKKELDIEVRYFFK